ncbi:MAG: type IV secretory system conjugative DNA transfer family protein [Clostridia bacterium]|nr:type IV secretory system conjugative DNA transfer family protein [Clostridia bacterium]
MKYIDKFLKKLNTNRNTFATYVLTLATAYIVVDRVVEMLLMIFTGVSYSYWGPIQYTLALACPCFAYAFSPKSKFSKNKGYKVTLFYVFMTAFYVITISMMTQWLNMGAWLFLLSVPNYTEIITEFSDLVTPAFVSLSLYLPLVTVYPFFKFVYFKVKDDPLKVRSLWDFRGIDISDKKEGHGPYTCEILVCTDDDYNRKVVMPETSRYQSLFVCGGSGTGKTSLVYEPFMAKDLERKHFFKEAAKELGFTALKTGIATLNKPFDNDYLNKNFDLSMLTPTPEKENIFNTYLKKMTLGTIGGETVYRNLGLTLMAPDYEVINHMMDVCKNFGIDYEVIDPNNNTSIGLNPFTYNDPAKIAVTISSVLQAMFSATHDDPEEAYRSDVSTQAIENVTILLKEIYPKMNGGALPNMEDLLKLFTNFELIEKMCEIMGHDEELREKYSIQLTYFKKYFYKNGPGKEEIEKYIYTAVSQLDNLLRIPGIKPILCNRHNNVNFDEFLKEGKVTFICTRRGDLGAAGHKAFGLFYLISMQDAVLRRPGNESTRIPHFLYIDEFADFICRATEPMFTLYRKFRVAPTISVQSLSQLEVHGQKENYRNLILSNCANKIFTGNAEYEELEWWSKELGYHREWSYTQSIDIDKVEYDSKYSNVSWTYVANVKAGKLGALTLGKCGYKIKGDRGYLQGGTGLLEFLPAKYKEPQKIKSYDFSKYLNGTVTESENNDDNSRKKFDLKNINFMDEKNEFNPIQTDVTDSNYLFNNDDAIIVNFKKGNPNNN